jgi:predicted amidohydrolase YtcJ
MTLKRRELLGYGASALSMAALGLPPLAAADQPADLVLRGGRVITVDAAWRIAEAIAVRDGRFAAIGTNAGIAGFVGPTTQVVELNGRTVVPGLIDTHLHQILTALNAPAVQLLSARSIADVQKAIAARVMQTPPEQWVVPPRAGTRVTLEEGRMPTRQELDPFLQSHHPAAATPLQ